MASALSFRPLTQADHQRLEHLCIACSDFFECIEGQPGGRELVGVVELLAGYPGPTEWYIGLLLLRPDRRGAGAGSAIWEHLRQRMIQEGATSVRLIVQQQNPRARRFWERQGFALEREMVATAGKLESPVWLLHRSLQVHAMTTVSRRSDR